MVHIYTGNSVLFIGLLFLCQYRLAFHYDLKANNEQGEVFSFVSLLVRLVVPACTL